MVLTKRLLIAWCISRKRNSEGAASTPCRHKGMFLSYIMRFVFVLALIISMTGVSAGDSPSQVTVTPKLVTPIDLVREDYVSTFLAVSGKLLIKGPDGDVERPVTFPVWARKNAISIPKDRVGELRGLCNELMDQARREQELAKSARALRERWMTFMSSISADQWTTPAQP